MKGGLKRTRCRSLTTLSGALIVSSIAAFARDSSTIAGTQSACGPMDVKFDVETDSAQRSVAPPEVEKALVYVIQDDGTQTCGGWTCITTKLALDGAWVGANRHNSYFSFAVEPGEHHLCAIWQSRLKVPRRLTGVAHFTAEAGKVYYFRTRPFMTQMRSFLDLDPIDSDQGKLFLALYPLSISRPRK